MNLVNHYGEIDCVSGIGIGGLRRVAKYAHFHASARSPVRRDFIVALIAALGSDNVADRCDLAAGRNEVERGARVVGSKVELGQVTRSVDPDGVRPRAIETGWRPRAENISVLSLR